MAKLTRAQEEQAWRYLMTLDNNTDEDIASLLQVKVGPVRIALIKLQDIKMARINKRVNKSYAKEKKRIYAEQKRKILLQDRIRNEDLDGLRGESNDSGTDGLDY